MNRFAIPLFVLCCFTARGQVSDFPETDFSKSDSIAERYAAHSLIDLKTLADKLTRPLLTEQEKFRAIYKWVCSNIEADYSLVTLNKQKRAKLKGDKLNRWNKKFSKSVFKTLLHERKTVCTGYAYLVRELAFHAGLKCEIVNGYAKAGGVDFNALGEVNHSWNRIQLNDKWYVCDATWSSGIFNTTSGRFVKKYDEKYFLMEPEGFLRSHHPSDSLSKSGKIN
jgi:transglutaminase/protease-like cytokinesis protein 3